MEGIFKNKRYETKRPVFFINRINCSFILPIYASKFKGMTEIFTVVSVVLVASFMVGMAMILAFYGIKQLIKYLRK